MKRVVIIFIIVFIFFGSKTEAGIKGRYDWWDLRIKEIERLKVKIENNSDLDKSIIDLLNREIRSGRRFLSLIEKYIQKDKSSIVRKKFTIQEINKEIDRIFPPLFSVYYLNSFVKFKGISKNYRSFKEKTGRYLSGSADRVLLHGSPEKKDGPGSNISAGDWKIFNLEVLMGNMAINEHHISAKIKNEVTKDIILKLAGNNYVTDRLDLVRTINSIIADHLDRFEFIDPLDFSEKAVRGSFIRKKSELYNNSHSKKRLLDEYDYRIKRMRYYIDFIQNLVARSSKCIETGNSRISDIFFKTHPYIRRVVKLLMYSLSVDTGNNLYSQNVIKIINKKRKAFIHSLAAAEKNIDTIYKKYYRISKKIKNDRTIRLDKFKENIAQHDVDSLYQTIIEYAGKYREYKYIHYIFNSYSAEFSRLKNDIYAGNFSAGFNRVLERDSIFPLIKEFNDKKIIREYNSKILLRREGLAAIARLEGVLNYYKRLKIGIADPPDLRDLNKFGNEFNRRSKIKISSWIMNSKNFVLVDKKAVKLLKNIAERRLWLSSIGGKAKKISLKKISTVNSFGLKLSISLPEGWNEKDIKKSPLKRDIIKYYTGFDNNTSISIAVIKRDSGSLKDISENWAKKFSGNLIKKRWGKKDNHDYFWILSKDNGNNIMQIYTFSEKGMVYIICGRSEGGKYIFFKGIFDKVFDSLEFEL